MLDRCYTDYFLSADVRHYESLFQAMGGGAAGHNTHKKAFFCFTFLDNRKNTRNFVA